jgi:hypothetical protein
MTDHMGAGERIAYIQVLYIKWNVKQQQEQKDECRLHDMRSMAGILLTLVRCSYRHRRATPMQACANIFSLALMLARRATKCHRTSLDARSIGRVFMRPMRRAAGRE